MWRQVQISYIPIFALSAVDVAVWDLAGKQAGLPVRHLLGGFRDQIPAYASSAFLDEPEEYLEDARMAVSNGIKRYKIHPSKTRPATSSFAAACAPRLIPK